MNNTTQNKKKSLQSLITAIKRDILAELQEELFFIEYIQLPIGSHVPVDGSNPCTHKGSKKMDLVGY